MVFRVPGVLISLSSARQRVSLQNSLLNLKIPRDEAVMRQEHEKYIH